MNIVDNIKLYYSLFKKNKSASLKERLDSYYKLQAEIYDKSRKDLLHGREELYQKLNSMKKSITWLDLGGGTGGNFECLGDGINNIDKAYIIDICQPLLDVARRRVKDLGWDQFEVLDGNITQSLAHIGKVDIVTCSYSLSMSEDWFKVIDNAYELLNESGLIGVVDFYVARKHVDDIHRRQKALSRFFWQIWFAYDNVFLSPDHIPYLEYKFSTERLFEDRKRMFFPPVLKAPYYSFIGRKLG
uniref:Betaine lipid synthase/S-adenosylmethionine-diacylgycerolhomoserine-N-methlytransferase n=1 Tax=Candidatus Kentrum sp. FW TaxID=2126338 RepID=A0A450TTC5_9GAMM|nr:MAG: betaine lipid synthase/S-adenosylmethionine-diacylgycerolhomoserine-N-methlytransferase [Candidatus Kentron sp. FW]